MAVLPARGTARQAACPHAGLVSREKKINFNALFASSGWADGSRVAARTSRRCHERGFGTPVCGACDGRPARLRHPVLADAARRAAARDLALGQPGVLEVRPGAASLLLLLRPEADFPAVCAALEAALPDLRRPVAEVVAAERRQSAPCAGPAPGRKSARAALRRSAAGIKTVALSFAASRSARLKSAPCWEPLPSV